MHAMRSTSGIRRQGPDTRDPGQLSGTPTSAPIPSARSATRSGPTQDARRRWYLPGLSMCTTSVRSARAGRMRRATCRPCARAVTPGSTPSAAICGTTGSILLYFSENFRRGGGGVKSLFGAP